MKNKYIISLLTLLFISNINIISAIDIIDHFNRHTDKIDYSPSHSAHFYNDSAEKHFTLKLLKNHRYCNIIYKSITSIYIKNILFADEKRTKTQGLNNENPEINSNEIEYQNTVLIKVMIIVLIIWFGLSLYLLYLHRKISKLGKAIDEC